MFFKNNYKEIYLYFNNKYNIDFNEFVLITKSLFNECNNLKNDLVIDYSKILIGNDLYKINNLTKKFIGSSNCIDYFDNYNKIEKKLIKK